MKYTFSSLGCMEASLLQLTEFAQAAGTDVLELRMDKEDRLCGLTAEEALPVLRVSGC